MKVRREIERKNWKKIRMKIKKEKKKENMWEKDETTWKKEGKKKEKKLSFWNGKKKMNVNIKKLLA